MNEEEYKKYKETKQELPPDVMIEEDEEAEDEENKPVVAYATTRDMRLCCKSAKGTFSMESAYPSFIADRL